ncbi:uncharacterized protein BX664DRAFT_333054 [Halteromyces radiatus]|uniref:uncharacterized protein n=1 Tax=Halteromyces radiatus TaxID=101107 RepID=UPI00221F94A5|nr:uncharacterized protein BX664DRAFT_333054 [Halteromyces radiatus]KAI8089455.1 hypothetical protein BX664DRAFT_333054 [Halteromyces radiatus]
MMSTQQQQQQQPIPQPTRSTPLRPSSRSSATPMLPTPSSSRSSSTHRTQEQLAQLKREICQQLEEKEQQRQECESGIQKNVLTRQISQLRDRLTELEQQEQDLPPATVDKLRHLERDLASYRGQQRKDKLFPSRGLDTLPSPSASTLLPSAIPSSLLPLPPPPSGSTPTKRRSKVPNNDRRNTDIEFATEIGQGLLIEVRKMQAILQEKEEQLRALELQRSDLERNCEVLAKQLRQREENEEKLKEETWNLELTKQELTLNVTELQQHLHKATSEQTKLTKQSDDLRSDIEQLRDREEKLTALLETTKQRHEQDMTSLRRLCAGLQREAQQHTNQIDTLTSELAIAKAQSRLGKHQSATSSVNNSTSQPSSDDTDPSDLSNANQDPNNGSRPGSPTSSPKQSPAGRSQAMEVETLKTSLAHAHRMVSNLRSNLHKEKTEKFEFKKLLADSQETIEQLRNDPHLWVDTSSSHAHQGGMTNGSLDDQKKRKVKQHRRTRKLHRLGGHSRSGTRKRDDDDNDDDDFEQDDEDNNNHIKNKPSRRNRGDDDDIDDDDEDDDDDDLYSYSSLSDENDDETPAGFTSLSLELSQSNAKISNKSVDANVMTDTIMIVQDPQQYERQLEKLHQLEQWHLASLDSPNKWKVTTLSCMDQAPVSSCETTTQTDPVTSVDMDIQTSTPETVHQDIQCDLLQPRDEAAEALALSSAVAAATAAAATATAPAETTDQGVQCDDPISTIQSMDSTTQVEPVMTMDASVQYTYSMVDTAVQHDYAMVDSAVQHEYSMTDVGVQHESTVVDQGAQYDAIETMDSATQHDPTINIITTNDMSTQCDKKESLMIDTGVDPITNEVLGKDVAIQVAATPFSSPSVQLANGAVQGEWVVTSRSAKDAQVQHDQKDSSILVKSTLNSEPETTTTATTDHHDWLGSLGTSGLALGTATVLSTTLLNNQQTSSPVISKKLYSQEEMDAQINKAVEEAMAKHKSNQVMNDGIQPVNSVEKSSTVQPPLMDDSIPARPTQPPPSNLLDKAMRTSNMTTEQVDYDGTTLDLHRETASASSVITTNNDMQSSSLLRHTTTNMSSSSITPPPVPAKTTAPSIASSIHDEHTTVVRPLPTTTDPTISSITQTMIGEWLIKYTRKPMGGQGFSERRHERYFWIHPYTRTLYWCTCAPGADGGELKAKSAFVEDVIVGKPDDETPKGVPCLLIQTSTRQLKIKAPTKERHALWLESLMYLLTRTGQSSMLESTPLPQRSVSASIIRKPSFQRINDMFQHSNGSQQHKNNDDDDDDDDEALENVRLCCDGKHDVGRLDKNHTHHRPSYHHQRNHLHS